MTRGALPSTFRVSTRRQTVENQEREAPRPAKARPQGGRRLRGYRERPKDRSRPAFLDTAHPREFDRLLIWALDRHTREGIFKHHQIRSRSRLAQTGRGFETPAGYASITSWPTLPFETLALAP